MEYKPSKTRKPSFHNTTTSKTTRRNLKKLKKETRNLHFLFSRDCGRSDGPERIRRDRPSFWSRDSSSFLRRRQPSSGRRPASIRKRLRISRSFRGRRPRPWVAGSGRRRQRRRRIPTSDWVRIGCRGIPPPWERREKTLATRRDSSSRSSSRFRRETGLGLVGQFNVSDLTIWKNERGWFGSGWVRVEVTTACVKPKSGPIRPTWKRIQLV